MIPRKLSKGDPQDLSARSHRNVVDSVIDLRERQHSQYPGDKWRDTQPRGTVIKALNNTPNVLRQYSCVELNGSRNDPGLAAHDDEITEGSGIEDAFKSRIYFSVTKPTTDDIFQFPDLNDKVVWGITQEPINPYEVGDVLIDGVTQAMIAFTDITATPSYKWAMPVVDETYLQVAYRYGNIEILWVPEIDNVGVGLTYPYWCIVRLSALSQHLLFWAVAQEDWQETGYPSGDPHVSCLQCDRGGANALAGAFDIQLPRGRDGNTCSADPAVYSGDVIKYMFDHEGTAICMSEYLHMGKITDIKIQGINTRIPTGWQECDGATKTPTYDAGAAAFDLHDFVINIAPVGGEAHVVSAMPRHVSNDEVQASHHWIYLIDALGEPAGQVLVPTPGDAKDDAGDIFAVEMGGYPTCTVMYIQRWK